MEGSGDFNPGFITDSCSSCSATPDQSPLTPFPIMPGFFPFVGFSALAASALQQGPMYPMLFCGLASPGGKIQLPPETLDQPPVFVNPQQFHRILKRRMTRRNQNWHARKGRSKSYIHESRHRHACNRERGPSGLFLPRDKMPLTTAFQGGDTHMNVDSVQSSEASK